ncbi:hypothetical protein COO60DRAFT_1530923 [Scenedesmus sp. NREL 46B-D3]|nr:hypothetical protein COO60DRAFT_1530923 [Scenedesmus sp. NREL 46B-D3]
MQANTLYVQNLAWSTLSEDLQEAFRSCQGVEDAFIMSNKNGRPAGYGFVRFGSKEAAAAAEQAMNGVELDGRAIRVRLARPGRTDAPGDSSGGTAESAAAASSGSGSAEYGAASETETRVVVSNLPAGFTYREVFGMCSLFGEVTKVIMYSKSSSKGVPGHEGDAEVVEQVEQDAAAVEGDAAADDEDEQGGSGATQQQEGRRKQGGSAVALMVGRSAAERVVAELDKRVVQGARVRAYLYRPRVGKKAAPVA